MQQFSLNWWLVYQGIWNQEIELWQKFAGLGKVIFICEKENDETISVCLNWDQDGKIINVQEITDYSPDLPTFRASKEMWQKFVDQEIKAAPAVMQGQIDYQGSLTLMIKYAKHFDYLAHIAQKIN